MSGPDVLASTTAAIDRGFALDVQSVDGMRRLARTSPDEALKAVSRQFEALLLGMVLKSMREATPGTGLLDGQSTKMYQSLLDQQLAQQLSGRGLKLADALLAQLRRTLAPTAPEDAPPDGAAPAVAAQAMPAASRAAATPQDTAWQQAGAARASAIRPARAEARPLAALAAELDALPQAAQQAVSGIQARVQRFARKLGGAAREAAAATGIPEKLILAQAALESAWGHREIRAADGSTTHNVFAVKADRSWRGPVAEVTTTEVVGGIAQPVRAKFRAYGSYKEAFVDYANFLAANPRYHAIRGQSDPVAIAHTLQRAGYATDPNYADKLLRVMKRLFE